MDAHQFIAQVNAELKTFEGYATSDGDRFALWFLTEILGFDIEDALEYHIGGPNDNKLDIGIKADSERSDVIILAQSKFSADPLAKVFDTDVPAELADGEDRLVRFPNEGSEKRQKFATYFNASAGQQAPKLYIVAGFGTFSDAARRYAQDRGFEIYDFDRIKTRVEMRAVHLQGAAVPISLKFSVEKDKLIEFTGVDQTDQNGKPRPKPPRQWIFLLRASEIRNALHQYKDSLFADNLRYRLSKSARSGIGNDIKNTILRTPEELSVYNNGLTVVARTVTRGLDKLNDEATLTLVEPQIVNGCQTSWAIYDSLEILANEHVTSGAVVVTKLIEVQDNDDLSEKIAKFANRQNAISLRDLQANDQLQVDIAMSFETMKPSIFFEYKEGTWESVKGTAAQKKYALAHSAAQFRRISNVQAAQCYLALLGLPHRSKQYKGRIFLPTYYNPIFNVTQPPEKRFASLKVEEVESFSFRPSGVSHFRDDVLFAFAVMQLSAAVKSLYEKKLKEYSGLPTPSEDESRSRELLSTGWTFLIFWQYLLVSLFQYVIDLYVNDGYSELELRQTVIGKNPDLWFSSLAERRKRFVTSNRLSDRLVLSDTNPSSEFPIFSAWLISLADIVAAHAKKVRVADVKFDMQSFIDQRTATVSEIKLEILDLKVAGEKKWKSTFPLDLVL